MDAQNPYESFIVQASAGSGKTYQLSRRFLYLVASGADPANILTLTFTVKAANEMRARILADAATLWTTPSFQEDFAQGLEKFHAPYAGKVPPPRSPVDTAKKILASTQLLKISTIDSLFHEWTRRFPWEAGVGEGSHSVLPHPFRIAEAHELAPIDREAWQRIFQPKWAPPQLRIHLAQWVALTGQGPLQLEMQLLAMHRHQGFLWEREQRGESPFLTHVPHGQRTQTEAELCERILPALRKLARETTQPDFDLRSLEKGDLAAIQGCRLITQAGTVSGTLFRGKKRETFHSEIVHVETHLQRYLDQEKYRILEEINQILQVFYEAWQRARQVLKMQKGLCEFSDLIQACYRIHHGVTGLGATWLIHKSLQHLLMDEFQDTSHLQWSIFEKVMEELLSGANEVASRLGPSTVFIVGDRKQSIYGFREADPYVLTLARDKVLAFQQRELSLDESFRSAPLICEYVNRVFGGDLDPLCPIHRSATCLPLPRQARVLISALFSKSADTPLSPLEQEAEFVAEALAKALSGAQASPVWDRNRGGYRALRPHDCCILYRNSTHASVFAAALQKKGIRVRREENQNLFSRPEIQDWVALLRFLTVPTDLISLLAFLRSPMGEIDDTAMLAFLSTETYPSVDGVLAWYREKDFARAEALDLIRKKAFVMPPSQLITRCLHDFSLYAAYQKHYPLEEGRIACKNIERFVELVFEQEKKTGASLVTLLQEVERWQKYGQINSATVYQEAVTLMTIHKSKGLEFPYVCVVETGESWFKEDRYWLKLKHPQPGLAYVGRKDQQPQFCPYFQTQLATQAEQQREESVRLLYVALTRSSQYLLLSGHETHARSEGFHGALWQGMPESSLMGDTQKVWEVMDPAATLLLEEEVQKEVPIRGPSVLYEKPVSLLPDHVELSTPKLREGGVKREVEKYPELQALVGTWIHYMLQQVVEEQPVHPEREWMRLVQKTGVGRRQLLSSKEWQSWFLAADQEVRSTIQHPTWKGLFVEAHRIVPEMEILAYEMPALIRGRVDLFLEYADSAWIIDYKTTPSSDLDSHRGQLDLYREAVTRYLPHKPVHCGIWFTKSCQFMEISHAAP